MAHLIQCRHCKAWVSSSTKPPCPYCGDKYITEEIKLQIENDEQMRNEMQKLQAGKDEEKKRLQAEESQHKEEIMAERKRNNRCCACGGPLKYTLSSNGHQYVCANKCGGHFRY